MPYAKVAPARGSEVAATKPSEETDERLRMEVTKLKAQVEQLEAENMQLKSGSGTAAHATTKLTKLWQTLEPLMTEALSACVLEEPDDPLGFVIERLSAALRWEAVPPPD